MPSHPIPAAVVPGHHPMWPWILLIVLAVVAMLAYKGWHVYLEIRQTQERDGAIAGLKEGWLAGLAEQRERLAATGLSPEDVETRMKAFEAQARASGLDPETRLKRLEELGEIPPEL